MSTSAVLRIAISLWLLGFGLAAAPPTRAANDLPARAAELIVVPRLSASAGILARDLPERHPDLTTLAVGLSGRALLVQVPVGREREYRDRLAVDPGVAAVSLNYEVRVETVPQLIPNDPEVGQQWALPAIQAPEAWAMGARAVGVTVAVIDTGADYGHPDLADVLLPGCSFLSAPAKCGGEEAADDHGHGTHVAGLIAAQPNNGIGIAGLAWGAKVLPLKALDASGIGNWFTIADAIAYAAHQPNVRVINLSLGSAPFFPPDASDRTLLQGVVDEARSRGIVVVAAAGNNGANIDTTPVYPAVLNGVIAATAVDQQGAKPDWANYGTRVTVAAPGVGILSTFCTYDRAARRCAHTYATKSGTSMASPYVSALAALLLAHAPTLSPDGVAQLLRQSATDLGPPGPDARFGAGRIDTAAALNSPLPIALTLIASGPGAVEATPLTAQQPGATITLHATPRSGALFIGWTVDGQAEGWGNPYTRHLDANHIVVARFAARPTFVDVAPTAVTAEPIAQLAARGVLHGYGSGRFGPDDTASRAQTAALLVRAMGWSGEDYPVPFPDRNGTDPELWRAVGVLAHYDVARGYDDGLFRPAADIGHLEAVSFVTRALIASGRWTLAPDDPTLYPNVPASSGQRRDLATFVHYVGAIPDRPATVGWDDWETPASRGWLAQVIWQALDGTYGGQSR